MIEVVPAPAKLTLSLRVTGVRDDGYHLLDAEMVTLALADEITIETGNGEIDEDSIAVEASGPYSEGIPLDERNLVWKALTLVDRRARIRINKRIPHGGGLGGGSADAAAILRWAGFADLTRAAALGADIPFCLVGGRARVQGIGEIVSPLPAVARVFTLIVPPLTCSTPAVYRAWDDLGGPAVNGPNDLLPAALMVEPRLTTWRDRIREAAGIEPQLAGSGATWFLDGHHPHLLDSLADAHVVLTKTLAENDERPPT